uniref:Uncharacterized protein n=1 Tax=Lepeophtheirus salmonis TaxID=72036 RepID=A0A0K2UPT9_LEPSM
MLTLICLDSWKNISGGDLIKFKSLLGVLKALEETWRLRDTLKLQTHIY